MSAAAVFTAGVSKPLPRQNGELEHGHPELLLELLLEATAAAAAGDSVEGGAGTLTPVRRKLVEVGEEGSTPRSVRTIMSRHQLALEATGRWVRRYVGT